MHIGELTSRLGRANPKPKSTDLISELHKFLINGRETIRRLKQRNEKRMGKERHKARKELSVSSANPFLIAAEQINLGSKLRAKVCPVESSEPLRSQQKRLNNLACPKIETTIKQNSLHCSESQKSTVCPTCLQRIPDKVYAKTKIEEKRKISVKPVSFKDEPVQVIMTRGKEDSKLAVNFKIEPHKSSDLPFVTISPIKPTTPSGNGNNVKIAGQDLGFMICIYKSKKDKSINDSFSDQTAKRMKAKESKKDVSSLKLSYRHMGLTCSFSESNDSEKPFEHRNKKSIGTDKSEEYENEFLQPHSQPLLPVSPKAQPTYKNVAIVDKYFADKSTSTCSSTMMSSRPTDRSVGILADRTELKSHSKPNLSVHFSKASNLIHQSCQTSVLALPVSSCNSNIKKSKDAVKGFNLINENRTSKSSNERRTRRDMQLNRLIATHMKSTRKSKQTKTFEHSFYEPVVPIQLPA